MFHNYVKLPEGNHITTVHYGRLLLWFTNDSYLPSASLWFHWYDYYGSISCHYGSQMFHINYLIIMGVSVWTPILLSHSLSPPWLEIHLVPSLDQVWTIRWWMASFGSRTPKRHVGWSNSSRVGVLHGGKLKFDYKNPKYKANKTTRATISKTTGKKQFTGQKKQLVDSGCLASWKPTFFQNPESKGIFINGDSM